MNAINATRAWLRSSPLIDKNDRFSPGCLGAEPTSYAITVSNEQHHPDIFGADKAVYGFAFMARLPFGVGVSDNINAAEFFSDLSAWIRAQDKARHYPIVDGYKVRSVSAANAGIIVSADVQSAQYQIQIQMTLYEEDINV